MKIKKLFSKIENSIKLSPVWFNQRALCINKRAPLFDKRELGLFRSAGRD